ncbi:MAG: galactokinase [Capsulimonadaceae bacterium]
MEMPIVQEAVELFRRRFGFRPEAAGIAPGRVELMGNHTDYNGGLVLSAAIDCAVVVAVAPAVDRSITIYSRELDRAVRSDVVCLARDPGNPWADYVLGVVDEMRRLGANVRGFTAAVAGTVPLGAGLSSSAALEVAAAMALAELFDLTLSPLDLALLCRRAECDFVGVDCGILDQYTSIFAQSQCLLRLDCRSMQHESVPLAGADVVMVVCNSGVKHALAVGDYNLRRAECMAAAAHFGESTLREVSYEEFGARRHTLPEPLERRARHIFEENRRVLSMSAAVRSGDFDHAGRLLLEGHESCRDLFENSTPEIDTLVSLAAAIDGCYGAKLTGGGWGGCSINLVRPDAAAAFVTEISTRYMQAYQSTLETYVCRISEGARGVPQTQLRV